MSEEQNIEGQSTDNSRQSTEQYTQYLIEAESQISNPNPDSYREEIINMETHHPYHITHKRNGRNTCWNSLCFLLQCSEKFLM